MPSDLDNLSQEDRTKVLRERLAAVRATLPTTQPASPLGVVTPWDDDLVPDLSPVEKKPEDRVLDDFLRQVDIIQAYRTFIGKMDPVVGNKTEGVMISCPMPGHRDSKPSAWINTEKQTWNCGVCMKGGDSYDLAAIHLGMDLESYKKNGTFPKLRRQMAEKLGFRVLKGAAGTEHFVPAEPATVQTPAPEPSIASVVPISPAPLVVVEEDAQILDFPEPELNMSNSDDLIIDWESLLPGDTFLRRYLEACTIDDLPHEYHIFNGLLALGFAGGTDIYLEDFKPIKPNLFVCLYGHSGIGKSRSIDPLIKVLEASLPYKIEDAYTPPAGVVVTPIPGSAESLLDMFKYEVLDPSTNQVVSLAQIKGLLRIEEFSSFVAKCSRPGSNMKETLIELYDIWDREIRLQSRGSGITRIYNPFVQVLTTTQPKAIHSFLRRTDSESGFLNRWIVAAGKSRRAPISYGGVTIDTTLAAASLTDIVRWSHGGKVYRLEGDAFDAWDAFFHRELARFKSGTQEVDSMMSRIDLTLKKLIILFTINERLDQPSGDTVERAVSFLRYLALTYRAFGSDIIFNDVTECEERVKHVIRLLSSKKANPPSKTEIIRYIGKKYDLELVRRALGNLTSLEIIDEKVYQPTRGPATMRYSVAGDEP